MDRSELIKRLNQNKNDVSEMFGYLNRIRLVLDATIKDLEEIK